MHGTQLGADRCAVGVLGDTAYDDPLAQRGNAPGSPSSGFTGRDICSQMRVQVSPAAVSQRVWAASPS
ncbi:hypothetical protein [Allobranchiibius sp. GilTou73]|uniref:hypothetical protein n=1 Tax=Allobranchiibius sp. GilTou73 TaxID=2904523 RepID=UPI00351D5790